MSRKKLTVVLSQDIPDVGKAGDLVAMKPGRARNHFFPKGMAMYDTQENRSILAAKGVEIQDVVIDKEEEIKAAATRSYPAVQGDLIRNMKWIFSREPVSSADNHIKKPVTKKEVLNRLRLSKFYFVKETDIEFPPGFETGLNHCGVWPCSVLLHSADASEYQNFNVNIYRIDQSSAAQAAAAAADSNAV